MKHKLKPALGSDVLAAHPLDQYAAPAARPARAPRERVQLNILLRSREDLATIRSWAFLRDVDVRDFIMAAVTSYAKSRSKSERDDVAANVKRILAARDR